MKIRVSAALCLALLAGSVSSAFGAPPPVEAFGSLPRAKFGKLSPDGKHLAVIRPYDGREKVAFYDLTKPDSDPFVVGVQDGMAGQVYWKGNNRAVCVFHANFKHRWPKDVFAVSRALTVDPAARTASLMLYNAPYFKLNHISGYISDIAADDPDHVYMPQYDRWDRMWSLDLYKVNLADGSGELALHGNSDTIEFLSDGFGHVVGRIDQDSGLTNHVIVGNTDALQYSVKGAAGMEIDGLTADPNPAFAVRKSTSSGTTGLYSWRAGEKLETALFADPNYDLEDTILDERTRRVIGVSYIDDRRHVKYFDAAMQRVQDTLEKAYPGQTVSIISKDEAASSYVFLTEGPKNPPVLSLYTVADRKTRVIEESYASLTPEDMGDVKPYPYKARDGLDIHAYLTLPPGKDPHNLPTVIFPHGGPEYRDSMEFDWWAQFMASRGYAVLQPNFRGSAGYGTAFVTKGDGEWAGKVQYDVQDGVAKLIADGIADPKRICIVGASYGGYMALAGATFSPDLYACAVSFGGLFDLDRALYRGTTFESETSTLWKRRIGVDMDSSKSAAESPTRFADQVKIPVLLIHSEKDATVPIEQSQIEQRALEKAHKQVEFVTLEGDDHHLEFAETRTKMLSEIERFLAAHIGK